MGKASKYLWANALLLVCLAVAWDKDESVGFNLIADVVAVVVIKLLVTFIGSKPDPRRV